MWLLSVAQRHVNCYDQGFKCSWERFNMRLKGICFPEFKAGCDGWCFTDNYHIYNCIYPPFTCLPCTDRLHAGEG